MLFRIAYPDAKPVYMNFLEIEKAVIEEKVDAGILIHESILEFDESLEVEKEIWDIWLDLSKEELPLPLGGMAIRRSIPILKAIECENMLIKAVKVANEHKNLLSKMLLERNLVRIDDKKLQIYLNMYANEDSAKMNEEQYKALDRLFEIGYKYGFYSHPIKAKEYLIPTQYKNVRFS
jgi:1,4-dihydroxy-6-naphthoate synthase